MPRGLSAIEQIRNVSAMLLIVAAAYYLRHIDPSVRVLMRAVKVFREAYALAKTTAPR
jgi:hypothetical protein